MRALITGASRGIGAAIALQLTRDARAAGQTVRLAIGATHPGEHLANLLSELKSLGADAVAVLGDLSDPAVPARLVSEAEEFCGGSTPWSATPASSAPAHSPSSTSTAGTACSSSTPAPPGCWPRPPTRH
ncbi:SDR family NAD(P)-dependent oxidoreductase [Thauera humireducens]|uniref:SDR family NAD(P)-dependent oxidoreductase n=1 Tax=Thauera humireducens TaxID=1134435 RepID=UPI00311F514F